MCRKKLFGMLNFTTYLNFVEISEVYPFMHNYRPFLPVRKSGALLCILLLFLKTFS